jgi:hypothetical protein
MNLGAQNSVLGRILWHQFNTVVQLRQNMRQDEQTVEDAKLRTALENMRYAACTPEDVAFLNTLVASERAGYPRLNDSTFRNVSIITALNIHKDAVNDLGAEQFARDTGQELVDFYSIDRLSSKGVDKFRWKNCEQAKFNVMNKTLQHTLRNASPSMTNEHIPGKLRLCLGMPIMIRVNEATELCMTKGQEAVVAGWHDSLGPAGQRILDTLFVRLIDPPKPVQLPGLPLNVVPLNRTSSPITCLLPDDTIVSIMRDQVLCLLNFAMTDYASQGKSRRINIVHLNNCKDHRAIYVALSRGTSVANTAIVQGFSDAKITSGLSGYLRQEFRELELLDEITRLRAEKKLPLEVCGIYRGQLISSYRRWNKSRVEPSHLHDALKWQPYLDNKDTVTFYSQWVPTLPKGKKPRSDVKRKAASGIEESRTSKKSRITTATHDILGSATHLNIYSMRQNPMEGLIWDSRNYSCGYDTLFTPLAGLLNEDQQLWTT